MSSPQQPTAEPQGPDAQAEQAGLAVALGSALILLWPQLDLSDLRSSLPAFKAAVALEVRRHAKVSATLAARQYRRQRAAADVAGPYRPVLADPPPVEKVAQAVDWATQPLWNADVAAHAATGGTITVPEATVTFPPEAPTAPEVDVPAAGSAIADAKARLAAAAEKQVLDTGRETIANNALRDRKAKGWVRVPEPDCCYWCAMLATRTPGFGSFYQETSFTRVDATFAAHKDVASDVKTHDHCRCHMEPVFGPYEPSAQVREWQALYKKVVTDEGRTGDDARIAFRQAIEGRPVTGGSSATGKKRKTSKASTSKSSEYSPDQIRAALAVLEKKDPNLQTAQQREWTRSRMAALRKQLGE